MVPALPERLLLDLSTRCNLRCPMCPVWGKEEAPGELVGAMDLAKLLPVLDAFRGHSVEVAPSIYGEPLLVPGLERVLREIKSRGLRIVINTNGLTMTEEAAAMLCDVPADSVMVSIDATTPETFRKVRSVSRIDKAERAVHRLLAARGHRTLPRIGVSFTTQDDNAHEEAAFVERWKDVVDVVRVGIVWQDGTFPAMADPGERKPCPVLWKTLPVHNDGSARLCCLDSHRQTDMGNVFRDGVEGVWHGPAFTKARAAHERGDYPDICKSCNGWAQHAYEEETTTTHLIRRSPEYVWWNRLDRLRSWRP